MHLDKSENITEPIQLEEVKSDFKVNENNGKKSYYFIKNSLITLVLYTFTYLVWYYIKRNSILLEANYVELFLYYTISIFVASILSNKAFLTRKHEFMQSLRKIYISLFLSLGILSLILLAKSAETLSRYVIIGSTFSAVLLESIYFYLNSEHRNIKRSIEKNPVSFTYLIPDLILLILSIYFLIFRNIPIQQMNERHILVIILMFLSWNYSALFTHKYNPLRQSTNNWPAAGLQLKFYLLIISSTALFIFTINIRQEFWPFFLYTVFVYSIVSFITFMFLYVRKMPYPTDEVTNVFLKAFELGNPLIESHERLNGKYRFSSSGLSDSVVKQKMQIQYFKGFPEVFNFLERELELQSFDINKTLVIRSADIYNVEVLSEDSIELFVNLHEINDLKRINDYFRLVNEKMMTNGIYTSCLIPIKNRYKIFQRKYPFLISSVFYFFDFIWRRVFPKIPVFRKLYFNLTKGKDRALSLSEGLGRLVYCGFEILDLTEINEYVFFAAKKIKEPLTDTNPSYSPIFKMKRVGLNGKQIFVYKIRTMHPYSEFLQEFIYKKNKLSVGGKFKDDFRITSWGRILRKLWIDELPMILNFYRGEIKLVGVRPVSDHYLSLYSSEFRERRTKYKPGLIPPFYADMPNTIEEIEASEKKYFEAFDRSPIFTDVKYFFKIIFNILFHKRRSA